MSKATGELQAAIEFVVRICTELGLRCLAIPSFGARGPVRFDLSDGTKEVRVELSYEFVEDLPGTKQFQSALRLYLTAIALRFPEQSFTDYQTLSGVPIRFEIDFPFQRSTEGRSVYLVHVLTKSGIDAVFEANFSVHLTHTVAITFPSIESVITEPTVVNAVREFIDSKRAVFYPEGQHPADLQVVTIASSNYDYKNSRFIYRTAAEDEIREFLKRKVYWLAFRRGNQATRVCIADPYDAAYLSVRTERLQQISAILAANGFVNLDSSGLYANAGNKLLQEAHEFENEQSAFFGQPSTTSPMISEKAASPPVPAFDVFICHASEDKGYVQPLVKALEDARVRVWFDTTTLKWGDDLRSDIDRGLINCRYGIVVFSKAFLKKKKWTEYELNSLFAREEAGHKLILPIWHGITREDLLQYSPALADRLAKISTTDSYSDIVDSLLGMLDRKKS